MSLLEDLQGFLFTTRQVWSNSWVSCTHDRSVSLPWHKQLRKQACPLHYNWCQAMISENISVSRVMSTHVSNIMWGLVLSSPINAVALPTTQSMSGPWSFVLRADEGWTLLSSALLPVALTTSYIAGWRKWNLLHRACFKAEEDRRKTKSQSFVSALHCFRRKREVTVELAFVSQLIWVRKLFSEYNSIWPVTEVRGWHSDTAHF